MKIEENRLYVCCLLHSTMGMGVKADIIRLPKGEWLIRCKICLELGRSIMSKAKAGKKPPEPKKLLCVGCSSPDPSPPDGAREYRCKACQEKNVPWPSPVPAVRPGGIPTP